MRAKRPKQEHVAVEGLAVNYVSYLCACEQRGALNGRKIGSWPAGGCGGHYKATPKNGGDAILRSATKDHKITKKTLQIFN